MTMRINTMYPCIQGEGVMAGTPMILLRLQGCGVGCTWCDTKESWSSEGGELLEVADVVQRVLALRTGELWVLLTGGEPYEQDCGLLTLALRAAGLRVAVETSGTQVVSGVYDHLCLSPKGRYRDDVVRLATEIKVVYSGPGSAKVAERCRALNDTAIISLQPEWGRRDKLLPDVVEHCRRNGWNLSMQLHKFAKLP